MSKVELNQHQIQTESFKFSWKPPDNLQPQWNLYVTEWHSWTQSILTHEPWWTYLAVVFFIQSSQGIFPQNGIWTIYCEKINVEFLAKKGR